MVLKNKYKKRKINCVQKYKDDDIEREFLEIEQLIK